MTKNKHMKENSKEYLFNQNMGKIESTMEVAYQLKRLADLMEKK